MTKIAVELKHVYLTFNTKIGTVEVLKDINLQIPQNKSTALIGPSGSGKSSLLMLIGGLQRATKGEIQALGQNLEQLDENELTKFRGENLGVVFQAFHLIPTMTALENVSIPLDISGAKEVGSRAKAALISVNLGHRLHHYPSQLSGGEQQRVALARAVITQPSLILADEPTGNLDQEAGNTVMQMLFDQKEVHGSTLIVVTHSLELAELCDQTIVLRDGSIISANRGEFTGFMKKEK